MFQLGPSGAIKFAINYYFFYRLVLQLFNKSLLLKEIVKNVRHNFAEPEVMSSDDPRLPELKWSIYSNYQKC